MFMRLQVLEEADPSVRRGAQDLIVAGALILALRRDDDRFGRDVGAAVWLGDASLSTIAGRAGLPELQRARVVALAGLMDRERLAGWPGLPAGAAA